MAKTFFILKAGIAPPGLASQPTYVKLAFWTMVVDLGLRRKDWELARGLNARGEPLPGVAPETRKHRKSAMTPNGKGDPSAPYLMPGRGLSRTRSLLTGKAHADYAEFYWRYDAHTGDQWGRVLAWHAARGKAYDVVGLSAAGIASVAQQAQKRWRQYLQASSPGHMVGLAPVAAFQPAQPTLGRNATLDRSLTPTGRTDLTFATFGIGGTKDEAQRAIDEGRSSGFRTQAEWDAYFRQKRAVGSLASPSTTSYSVRKGNSNVLLQAVWGAPPKPPDQAAMRRAAMPPTPHTSTPTPPIAKPTPHTSTPTTPPAFPPSTATVEYGGWDARSKAKAEKATARVLKGVPPERYASIVGAPDDARVIFDASGESAVSYTVKHPSLDDMRGRLIRSDLDGVVRHAPDVLYVKESDRGKGVGTEIHGRRVAYGVEHGIARIAITAARGKNEIGYIVWPAMGYDGKLPKSVLDKLPEQFQGRTTIQELLADEGGQKWWKKHGEPIDVAFSLKPGSPAIMRWATYWLRKLGGKS